MLTFVALIIVSAVILTIIKLIIVVGYKLLFGGKFGVWESLFLFVSVVSAGVNAITTIASWVYLWR